MVFFLINYKQTWLPSSNLIQSLHLISAAISNQLKQEFELLTQRLAFNTWIHENDLIWQKEDKYRTNCLRYLKIIKDLRF